MAEKPIALLYTGLRVRKLSESVENPEEDGIPGWKEVEVSLLAAGWRREFLSLTPLGWTQHPSEGREKVLYEFLAGFGIEEAYPGRLRPHPSARAFLGPKGFLARLGFAGWLVSLEIRDTRGNPVALHGPRGSRLWKGEEGGARP